MSQNVASLSSQQVWYFIWSIHTYMAWHEPIFNTVISDLLPSDTTLCFPSLLVKTDRTWCHGAAWFSLCMDVWEFYYYKLPKNHTESHTHINIIIYDYLVCLLYVVTTAFNMFCNRIDLTWVCELGQMSCLLRCVGVIM